MEFQFSAEDEAFRQEVRDFIDEHYTADMRARAVKSLSGYLYKDDHVRWQKALYEKGWIAPNWPVEYGGAGFTPTQKYIFETEIARKQERYGNLVHAFSTYESRNTPEDPEPFMRGINSIQLVFQEGRWWIVNVAWQPEWEGLPIPDAYLQ